MRAHPEWPATTEASASASVCVLDAELSSFAPDVLSVRLCTGCQGVSIVIAPGYSRALLFLLASLPGLSCAAEQKPQAGSVAAAPGAAQSDDSFAKYGQEFKGKIAKTYEDSVE